MLTFSSYLSSFPETREKNLYFHQYGAFPDLAETTITQKLSTGYWVGDGRTTPILTNQSVGMLTIKMPVVYIYSFGQEAARVTDAALRRHANTPSRRAQIEACMQRVERAMLGKVVLNIGDGYRYQCILTEISDGKWERNLSCTKIYTFDAVKAYEMTRLEYDGTKEASVEVASTVPRTDCRLTLTHPVGEATSIIIKINDQEFGFSDSTGSVAKGPVVLDGWDKVITMGGDNLIKYWSWTDFPFLAPGTNTIWVSIDGTTVYPKGYIEYYPTFL